MRPLDRFYTRVRDGRVEVGDRFSLNSQLERFAAARPVEPPRRALAVPLPVEADHLKLPSPPLPKFLRPTPPRPGRNGHGRAGDGSNGHEDPAASRRARSRSAPPRPASRRSAGSTSAPALSPFLRGFLYRKVPKGTNWFYTLGSATMFAFLSQAVTGVFLAMYYDPDPTRAYDVGAHITNDVFLGELVRGMHSGAPR